MQSVRLNCTQSAFSPAAFRKYLAKQEVEASFMAFTTYYHNKKIRQDAPSFINWHNSLSE
jgi:hypothetical protein